MSDPSNRRSSSSTTLTRRELLAGAGAAQAPAPSAQRPAGAGAGPQSQRSSGVFTYDRRDPRWRASGCCAGGAGQPHRGDRPDRPILAKYPGADVYDGRGKALFPGLINCHAHMGAVLARGYNEDFGFPNSNRLEIQPGSLLAGRIVLMIKIAALECIRTGTTTVVEFSGNIGRHAAALADSGLRCVFAEGVSDVENPAGPVSAERLAEE